MKHISAPYVIQGQTFYPKRLDGTRCIHFKDMDEAYYDEDLSAHYLQGKTVYALTLENDPDISEL